MNEESSESPERRKWKWAKRRRPERVDSRVGGARWFIALCSVVPGPSTINIVNLRLGIVIKLSYSYVSNVINHSSYILNE